MHSKVCAFYHRVLSILLLTLLLQAYGQLEATAAEKPRGIPTDAVPFELSGLENQKVFVSGNSLYTEIKTSTAESSLRIPRLANVVQSIQWQSAPETRIALQPEPDHWIIRHGKQPVDSGDVLIINFDGPPLVFDGSEVIQGTKDGVIFLPAKLAKTSGDNLRYEPQPHKNTVGYWSNVNATAEWRLSAPQMGSFEVDILQGCGSGHGGSTVEIQIGKESRTFVVEETGHFQNFIWRTIGTVDLNTNETITLKLTPKSKPGGAVMDVRAVRLSPPGAKRSFESELAAPDALPKKQ